MTHAPFWYIFRNEVCKMNELTKEFLEKAMECETTEELIALAKE